MAKSKVRAFISKTPGMIVGIPQNHPEAEKLEQLCLARPNKRRGIEFKKSLATELHEPELIEYLLGDKEKGLDPHPSVLNGTIKEIETAEQRAEREKREKQAAELESFAALVKRKIVNLDTLDEDQCKAIAADCGISLQGLKDLKGWQAAVKKAVKEKL